MARVRRYAAFLLASMLCIDCGQLLGLKPDDERPMAPQEDAGGGPVVVDSSSPHADAGAGADAREAGTRADCAYAGSTEAGCEPIVFVSSEVYRGDFGGGGIDGLARGDGRCADLARDHWPKSTFKAWLSVAGAPAAGRLLHTPRPYRLPNGDMVARSWDDLVDSELLTAITRDENGLTVTGETHAWTGTTAQGTAATKYCGDWVSGDLLSEGTSGDITSVTSSWSAQGQAERCDRALRVYCIEQVP